jgi:hypothetical protein
MANKKAFMGIKWFFLGFACLISFGTALFFIATANLPIVGEYPVAVASALEEGTSIQSTLDSIMHQLHKEANESFEKNPHVIFTINSYCTDINDANQDGNFIDDTDYKVRLRNNPSDLRDDESFIDDTGILSNLLSNLGKERRCYVDEDDLMEYYAEYFEQEYESFRYWNWPGLGFDLRETEYTSEMEKDQNTDEYFLTIKTTNGLKIPITMVKKGKEKIVGEFVVAPDFKFRTENLKTYPFDDTEICILSRDCGATCNEVLEKYPSGERDYNGYEIIDEGTISVDENTVTHLECERYYDCETPLDDFGKTFKCDRGVLCEGACLPFCSIEADSTKVPDDSVVGAIDSDKTKCTAYGCNSYMDCTAANSCECFSNELYDNNCKGDNCVDFNCDRDPGSYEFSGTIVDGIKTICKDRACDSYVQHSGFSCSGAATCSCDTGKTACFGECCDARNNQYDCSGVNYGACYGKNDGTQEKQRECSCKSPSQTCGGSCNPPTRTDFACCAVDGGWSDWSECSEVCGGGIQTRTCSSPAPSCGGNLCDGPFEQECNTEICDNPEPDCIDQCMGDVFCEADCVGF